MEPCERPRCSKSLSELGIRQSFVNHKLELSNPRACRGLDQPPRGRRIGFWGRKHMQQPQGLPWEKIGDDRLGSAATGSVSDDIVAGLDKVLRLLEPKEWTPDSRGDHKEPTRDFSPLADRVHRAAEAMKAINDRAQAAETRAKTLLQRASEEIKVAEERAQAVETRARNAETRIQAAEIRAQIAEARARDAEARARDSEARAHTAEEWLTRLYDIVMDQLAVAQSS